jgi:hypothetical protein
VDIGQDSATLGNTLGKHFTEDSRAQLVAALDPAGKESRRFFVTAAGWPD